MAAQIEVLQNVEHFDKRRSAGRRRRSGQDFVVAVRAAHRPANHRPIGGQVGFGDQAATAAHLAGDQRRRFSHVESVRAPLGNSQERIGEFRLHELVAGLPRSIFRMRECFVQGAERLPLAIGQDAVELAGHSRVEHETVARQLDRGHHQFGPWAATELRVRGGQSTHRARHTHATVRAAGRRVDKHVAGGSHRGRLAKVEHGCRPALVAGHDQHVPATANVSGGRIGHCQRKGGGHRGVDSRPATLECRCANFGRGPADADNGTLPKLRAAGVAGRIGQGNYRSDRSKQKANDHCRAA